MPRELAGTLGLLLVLGFAGCAPTTANHGAAPTVTAQDGVATRTANQHLLAAKDALSARDLQRALAAYNAAVAADPRNIEVRLARGGFLLSVLEATVGEESRQAAIATARADFEYVISSQPEALEGARAADSLRLLDGKPLFPVPEVACPEPARKARAEAARLIAAGLMRDTLPHYRTIVETCPDDAHAWMSLGHVYYVLRNFDAARRPMEEALARDPWMREGQRYFADLERTDGRLDSALHHALLAILSDPTYEQGWFTLRQIATQKGAEWRRIRSLRATVRVDVPAHPAVILPPELLNRPKGLEAFWLSIAFQEVTELKEAATHSQAPRPRTSAEVRAHPASGTSLEAERRRVKEAVGFCRHLARDKTLAVAPECLLFDRATSDGYLDEAIFIHLMDTHLVPEYQAYREQHQDRLLEYMQRYLVVPR